MTRLKRLFDKYYPSIDNTNMTASNLDKVYGALREANGKSKRPGHWSSVSEVEAETKTATNVGVALEILVKEKWAIKHKERLLYKTQDALGFGGGPSGKSKREQDRGGQDRGERFAGAAVGAEALAPLARVAQSVR